MVRSQKSPMLLAAEDRDPEITSQFFLPWFDSACDSRSHWCPFLTCGSYCRCPSRIHSGFAPSLFLGQKAVLLTTRSNLHDWYLPGWGHRWGEFLSPFRAFSAKDSGENKWGQGPKWHFHDCHFFFHRCYLWGRWLNFWSCWYLRVLQKIPTFFHSRQSLWLF